MVRNGYTRRVGVAPLLFYRAWKQNSLNLVGHTLEVRVYPPLDWMKPSQNPPWKSALTLPRMPPLLCLRGAEVLPLSTKLSRWRHWVMRWMGKRATQRKLFVGFM